MGQPVFAECTERDTVTALMVIMCGPMRAPQMSREEKKRFRKKAPRYLRDIRKGCHRDAEKRRKRSQEMDEEDILKRNASMPGDWQFYD